MKIHAIIPARGGSKGIPKKNIVDLQGRPLISYSIGAAKESSLVDNVFVTSDSEEILSVSEKYGADCVKRPVEISDDKSKSEDAILDVIVKKKISSNDIVIFLQATSPLVTSSLIDESIKKFIEFNHDSMTSVFKEHGFFWNNNTPCYDPQKRPMRQDQQDLFKEAGMFYIFKVDGFLKKECRLFGNMGIFEIPRIRAFEIDDQADLDIVSCIMNKLNCSVYNT